MWTFGSPLTAGHGPAARRTDAFLSIAPHHQPGNPEYSDAVPSHQPIGARRAPSEGVLLPAVRRPGTLSPSGDM